MNTNGPCGIYAIYRVGTDDCYVGQSVNIAHRWTDHLGRLRRKKHTSRWLQRVFDKYGAGALSLKILETGFDVLDTLALTAAEDKWIKALKPCFNVAPAAASTLGLKKSRESRARCSAAQKRRWETDEKIRAAFCRKGKPSGWKGQTPTAETRLKMAAAKTGKASNFRGRKHTAQAIAQISLALKGRASPNKGKPRSPEANAKQSASMMGRSPPNKGIPCPQEVRLKISLANRGKPWSEKRRAAYLQAKQQG